MSDYVHKKVVRLPFPDEILDICNTDDPYDCESYLRDILGDLFSSNKDIYTFEIESTDESCYLDWVYYYTYGDESGDWGNVSLLNNRELEKIKPLFKNLPINFKDSDLRKVDYCYYNCCECEDYYEINTEDHSNFFRKLKGEIN
jgi:hypothetical protein